MNTSSRVPGITRNSGWQAVHAEMSAREQRLSGPSTSGRSSTGTRHRGVLVDDA